MTGKNDRSKKSIYLYYTIIFALMSLVVFRLFILQDKTFIHNRDGWAQHLKALAYYSGYLRDFFSDLFTGQGFKLPMWDFSIGEGSDILISLHYYCIGDPISFFSVFFPEEKIYLFYDLSVLLRLYLSGICFIRFCRYMHKENVLAILSGAIVYVFCYWNLLNATKHIFFLNPMLYLPLVLLGVERVIRNDRAWLCSVYVMLGAMTSFYFFYMIVILTVIYVAVRLVFLYRKEVRMIVTTVMRIFVYSLLGFLMSAVISFPIINAMLSNNRLDADYGLQLLYSAFYYDRLPTIFLTTDNTVWLCMGFASPVILSTLMTLKEAKTEPELFCLHVIAILMICFPIFGKIMNGMTYVSNRWSFALALLVAYTLVCKWDRFENNKRFLMIFVPVFLGLSFFSAWQREAKIIPGILCVLFLLAVLFPNEKGKGLLKQGVMLILILCSIAYMADISYSASGRNRIDSMVNTSEAGNIIGLTEAYQFKELMEETGEDGFFRYSGSDLTANAAILAGTHSTDYYFSIANPDVFAYRSDLGVNEYSSYYYYGYENRSILYTLANVKYYIAPLSYKGQLPFGFQYLRSFGNYDLYQNNNPLPFGYTYETALSYSDWAQLSQIEKEEALLSSVVLDNGGSELPVLKSYAVDCDLPEGNRFTVDEVGQSFTIDVEGAESCVYYLSFEGMRYEEKDQSYFRDRATDAFIEVSTDRKNKHFVEYHTPDYQFYNGRDDFSVYLGYHSKKVNEIKLAFSSPGTYTFDRIYVTCMPMGEYAAKISALSQDHLENVVMGNDEIRGTIDAQKDEYLLLSVPYSKGWKAYVDGEKAELYQANEAYMALDIKKGTHEIRLCYETPLLKVGELVSVISTIALIVYTIRRKRSVDQKTDVPDRQKRQDPAEKIA